MNNFLTKKGKIISLNNFEKNRHIYSIILFIAIYITAEVLACYYVANPK